MKTVSDYFGCLVFDDRVMKAKLSAKVYTSLKKTIDEGARPDNEVANAVAAAMKDWAVENGATHFTHWCCGRLITRNHGVLGKRAYQGRTGCLLISVGRTPCNV